MSLVIQTEPLEIFEDPRGQLIKAWPRPHSGEVYVVELLPGHPRGNHLHHHGGEWFVPLQGEATLFIVDPETGDQTRIELRGIRARVEPGQAHALVASGDQPALVLAVADLSHDQEETTAYKVLPS
jgi:uncharacterized cupin superfamily protein